MSLHPVLERLFAAWHDAGVVWALLREPADPARPEGDIDLLLDSASADAAEAIAREQGFVPVPGHRFDRHLLRFDRASGQWLWLHCVTELTFGPYRAVRPRAECQCLESRRMAGLLALLAPEHEFWVTLMHGLLDQGRLSERTRRRLAGTAARARSGGALPDALGALLPAGWTPRLVLERATVGDWPGLEGLALPLRKAAARLGRPALSRRLLGLAPRVVAELRTARARRGVSVALLGPDGAGKSTLGESLRRSSVFPSRQVYMGLTGGWLRHVDRLRVPGIVRVGRLLVIWGRYLRGQYHVYRGRLVVFDRYVLDAEVPPPYPLGPFGRLARRIDGRSCPPPDLVLILDAPGTVMHQRKGEYTPETLEDWRQRFLGLGTRLACARVLDTTQPPDVVQSEAMEQIWRLYAKRWTGA
ncbi:MAG TPA: hypothetical protein VFZ26_10930 [Gemmatimonadales bacterium]